MTAATPWRQPVASATTGMPPPPTVMTTKPPRDAATGRRPARRCGSDAARATTRRQPRPASSTTIPAVLIASLCRAGLVHEGADGLGRMLERRIVGRDLDLGDDRDRPPVDAHPPEVVAQLLLELIADGALACPRRTRRAGPRGARPRQLRAAQDEADLRAVAVPDRHLPAVADGRRDVNARLAQRAIWSGTADGARP